MRRDCQQVEKMRVTTEMKTKILLTYFCILYPITSRFAQADQIRIALSDAPSLVPSNVPNTFPSGIPSIRPTSVQNAEFVISSSDAPSLIPSGFPSSAPVDLESDLPSINVPPWETTVEVPNAIRSLIPSVTPTSGEKADFLSESPSLSPSDFPSEVPAATPSDIPSSVPSIAPTIVQNAEFVSDFPSISPNTVPSIVPSGNPGRSDTPSLVPSDVPSLTPNDVPSQIPSERPSSSVVEIQNGTSLYQFFVIPDPIYVQTQFPDTMDRDTVADFETVCANDFLPAYLQLTKDGIYKNLTCDVIDQTIIDSKTKPTGQLLVNHLRRMRQKNLSDNENQTYQLEIILSVAGLSSFSPSDSDIKGTVSETFSTFGPILEDKLGSEIGFFNDPSADSINGDTNKSKDGDNGSNIAVRWQLVLAAVFAGAVLSVIAALYVLRRAYVLGPHSAVSGTQSDLQASGSAGSGEIVFDVNTATSRITSLRSSRSSGQNKVQQQDQTLTMVQERTLPPINCKLSASETSEYPGPHPLTSINACDDNGVDFESDISASLYDESSVCHRTNGSNTITELRPDGTIIKRERLPTDENNSLGGIILSVSGLLRGLNEKLDGVISPKNVAPRKPLKQSLHDDERRSDTSSELEGMKLFTQGTASKGSSVCSQTPILDSLLSFRKKKPGTEAELQKFQMFMSESSSTPDDPQELDDVVCIAGSSRSRSNTNTTDSDKQSHTSDHDNYEDEDDNEDEVIFAHPTDGSKQIQYRSRIESPDDSYSKIKSRLPPRRAGSIGSGNRRPLPPPSRSSSGGEMMHITDTVKKSNRSSRIIHYGRPPTPPSTRTRSNSISSNNDDPDPALMTICSL